MTTYKVLSLGAGVQSSAVLLMSCKGLLPKLDAAVFADTQWEPPEVYETLAWLVSEAARHGIPVHTISKGDLRQHAIEGKIRGHKEDGERYAVLPVRIVQEDGSLSLLRRQCTSEYKIQPVTTAIRRKVLGLLPGQRIPPDTSIDQWMGISLDELGRMKPNRKPWIRNVYPLIGAPKGCEYLSKPFTRADCKQWLAENYPGQTFHRSACIGCPYRGPAEWQAMKEKPELWADAVEVDEAIRDSDKRGGKVYLHRSYMPLAEAPLFGDPNQGDLFDEECTGYCGM